MMDDFLELKSVKKLKELAIGAFDLTQEGAISASRVEKYTIKTEQFLLSYALERVDDVIISQLAEMAKESRAVFKMQKMQEGEVVNCIENVKSENRAALHCAARDFFANPIRSAKADEARLKANEELSKLESFLAKKSEKFHTIVQVGIGGSFLGVKAIYHALSSYKKNDKQLVFIANLDPDDTFFFLKDADISSTLFVIVSKSGSTLETAVNEQIIRDFLTRQGISAKEHMVAVTEKGSKMDDCEKYLECFYIWDYIGGRFSATSMVGGVTLSLVLGPDVYKGILKGASKMDKTALLSDPLKNLPLFGALLGIWNRNFLNIDCLAIIPYSQGLLYFPDHLQQVDMESNGKSVDKKGKFVHFYTAPVIFGDVATNAQHSFFQYLHQGTTTVATEFIGFKMPQYPFNPEVNGTSSQQKLLANLLAQGIALAQGQMNENPNRFFSGNRPSHLIFGKKIGPESIGALLAYYEHKIVFEGFIWNINSFDQEGVQLGKKIADELIQMYKEKKAPPGKEFEKAYIKLLETTF